MRCEICQSTMQIENLLSKNFVFSDCKVWTGELPTIYKCECGYVRKSYKSNLWDSIVKAYEDYSPFFQSSGVEQLSVISSNGHGKRRSDILVEFLLSNLEKRTQISVLDYGCGNGPILKSIRNYFDSVILSGADLGEKPRCEIESIQAGTKYVNLLESRIDESYDLVSLIHVLEHLENPRVTLSNLVQHLNLNGYLLIQVPNTSQNPFDMQIIDHISHFSTKSLFNIVKELDLEIIYLGEVIGREITVLLRKSVQNKVMELTTELEDIPISRTRDFLSNWRLCIESNIVLKKDLYIFGTSIAASWVFSICSELCIDILAFVDEDPSRVGSKLFDRRIISVEEYNLLSNSAIFLALTPNVANQIQNRIKGTKLLIEKY